VWDSLGGEQISFTAAEAGQDFIGCVAENNAILASLQAALVNANEICRENGVDVIPSTLKSMDPDPNSEDNPWQLLTCANGETHSARVVVGADGANSLVREISGLETVGWDHGQSGIVATLDVSPPESDSENATAWQRYLPTGPVAILPVRLFLSCFFFFFVLFFLSLFFSKDSQIGLNVGDLVVALTRQEFARVVCAKQARQGPPRSQPR